MVFEVLNYLKLRLNIFLSDGRKNSEPLIVLSNPWANNDSNKGASFLNSISLINIEEEKIFKTQVPPVFYRDDSKKVYTTREPDLKLNLYILISSYNKSYEDALKFISRVVGFFQANNVFSHDGDDNEDLPEAIERVIVELYTAGFEQQNQIWASLSTGYIPSVIYKVRMLTIDLATLSDEQKAIRKIQVNSKHGSVFKGDPKLESPNT